MNAESDVAAPVVAYVANASSNDIMAFALDPVTGSLELIEQLQLTISAAPLAFSPDRRFLFAGLRGEQSGVASFAIDPASGRLRVVSTAKLADRIVYLSTDRSGRFLLAASYTGAVFAITPIDDDGRIAAQPTQVTQTPPHAHAILTDPANRFLFVTSLGGDVILQYIFDSRAGTAIPNGEPFIAAPKGSGPRHLIFHPRGDIVYVNGELDGTIGVYRFDAQTGRLAAQRRVSIMPASAPAAPWAAEIAVAPGGRFLYASERRTSTLAVFAIRAESGLLDRIAGVPTEAQPRTFAIDPSGRFLIVAGETSNYITTYAIDRAGGSLEALARYPVGEKPASIGITSLGA